MKLKMLQKHFHSEEHNNAGCENTTQIFGLQGISSVKQNCKPCSSGHTHTHTHLGEQHIGPFSRHISMSSLVYLLALYTTYFPFQSVSFFLHSYSPILSTWPKPGNVCTCSNFTNALNAKHSQLHIYMSQEHAMYSPF